MNLFLRPFPRPPRLRGVLEAVLLVDATSPAMVVVSPVVLGVPLRDVDDDERFLSGTESDNSSLNIASSCNGTVKQVFLTCCLALSNYLSSALDHSWRSFVTWYITDLLSSFFCERAEE